MRGLKGIEYEDNTDDLKIKLEEGELVKFQGEVRTLVQERRVLGCLGAWVLGYIFGFKLPNCHEGIQLLCGLA